MARDIEIIEVGPRDGLQNQDEILATADKIELIGRLRDCGARRIEAVSFVNPRRVPQMEDAEAVLAGMPPQPDTTLIGLVLNARGLQRALETRIGEIGAVAVASDEFAMRNQKQTSAESVTVARRIVREAKAAGRLAQVTIAVAFGCPFEGEVPLKRVLEMAAALAEEEPHEIALADTVGVGVPRQVKEMVQALGREIPAIPLRLHFHNTRNTGMANALQAAEAGVMRLDASIGGIGGCPFAPAATGNIATEDLVYLLERSGFRTGLELDALVALVPWLGRKLGLERLPGMVSRAPPFPPPDR